MQNSDTTKVATRCNFFVERLDETLQVMVDGISLKDFDPGWLRNQLGIVGQEMNRSSIFGSNYVQYNTLYNYTGAKLNGYGYICKYIL